MRLYTKEEIEAAFGDATEQVHAGFSELDVDLNLENYLDDTLENIDLALEDHPALSEKEKRIITDFLIDYDLKGNLEQTLGFVIRDTHEYLIEQLIDVQDDSENIFEDTFRFGGQEVDQ